MTKLQIAKIAMISDVQKVLANNKSIWSGIKPIADEVANLDLVLDAAGLGNTTQFQNKTGGYTNQKDVAMELMNGLGYKMGLKLSVWARKSGDEVSLKAVSFFKTVLESGTETEQINRNTSIATVAASNLGRLINYQIDADSLASFQAAIALAKALTITRDAVGSTGQAATKGIVDTIKKSVDIFEDLDALIESMLTDNDKAFEDAYFAARKVEYHRGGSKHVEPVVPVV